MAIHPDSCARTDRLFGKFQAYVQRIRKLFDLDWFCQIPEESCLQDLLDVAWHCIRTDGNNGDVRRCRVFAQDLQGFETAHTGQIDVHQDHLWLVTVRKFDAENPVRGAQQAHIRAARDELFDQLQVSRVIFYIEQGAQRRAGLDLNIGHCHRFSSVNCKSWCSSCVQFEPKHASHPDSAFHADHTSHKFHYSLAHYQADACAFFGAALLSQTVERLKKLRQLFRSQPRAGVPYPDASAFRGACGAVHDYLSPQLVVFDCVGKKVDENLLQSGSIGTDKARGVELGKSHFDAPLLSLRVDHGPAFDHDFSQRY